MSLHNEAARHVGDGLSLVVVIGTLAQWLPSIAAAVSIVWGLIRIWETRTVQGWLGRPAAAGGGEDEA